MTESRETLASAISTEITRVGLKREHYRAAAQTVGTMGNMRPALYMMDQAIHFAREARDCEDVVDMVRALKSLREFGDD